MTAPAAPAAAPKGRLGNGQLRRQVAEYLTDHPGPCKTGEIAKALDRSAGAVGNALTTLADRGEADLLPGKPIRYQANSATAAAASAITPKAPLPPKPAPAPKPAAPAAPAAPAPAPTFTPKPATAGPVTRPGGQVYQPRSLADMPDVEALRKLRDGGVPALLYGPPDAGAGQQVLHPVRCRVPGGLGHGPAVVILELGEQSVHHIAAGLAGFPPGEAGRDLPHQVIEQPLVHLMVYRDISGCRLIVVFHKLA
jgi:hypothetical protein